MTTDVARSIRRCRVPEGAVAVFWLGQAGFVFKTPGGRVAYVDPYLSDSVERLFAFRRVMAGVVAPRDVRTDAVLISHHHDDHLDVDAVPVIAARTRARFVAPPQAAARLRELGVEPQRIVEVREGAEAGLGFVTVHAVFADHGELAPDAVGFVLDFEFTRVYLTGDTAYRPGRMTAASSMKPDLIIPVINGAYGNMTAADAAALTRDAGARVAIPCHFWMFAEHGGDPAAFRAVCARTAPGTRVVLMTQGGCYLHGPQTPDVTSRASA
jgi:L-ascorbate 6-phosphate lactonase